MLFLTLNITLDNVNISTGSTCPFSIGSGSTVNLTLSGTNSLDASGGSNPGLGVPEGAALNICAYNISDSLTANGGSGGNGGGAGIGGGPGSTGVSCGTVNISGGTVIAQAGYHAAGIGGGQGTGDYRTGGNGGIVKISGGIVKASGKNGGAGIGGGNCSGNNGKEEVAAQ